MSNSCGTPAEGLTTEVPPWFGIAWAGQGRLRLTGELDLAGAPVLQAALSGMDGDMVIDCSDLTFIDCSGLNVLIGAHKACEAKGARLSLLAPPPCFMRVLEAAGLDGWFDIRDSSEG